MFGLRTRPARPRVPAPRQARLTVERLETRDCPSAPVITSFTATNTSGSTVQLTGTVTDTNPASVTVSFSGVMSGSTTADSSGHFSYTANASQLGEVDAVGTDGQQLTSNTAAAQVAAAKPTLTLSWDLVTQNRIELWGKVTAPTPGGLTVTLSGVVSGTTVTNPDGSFTAVLGASGVGQVQATVADCWGQVSDAASVTVSEPAPVITGFTATNMGGTTWKFQGTVTDSTPSGLTVQLSGTPSTQGKTATTQSDGSFRIQIALQPGEAGMVGAVTTDWFNLTSQMVYDAVG